MINYFKLYSIIWIVVLILYSFSWSDLFTALPLMLVFFLFIMISCSWGLGLFVERKLKIEDSIKEVTKHRYTCKHKHYFCFFLFGYFVLTYLYAGMIPILKVLGGTPYHLLAYKGIPYITVIMSTVSVYESFHLSYRYFFLKDKKALWFNLVIMFYFLSLVQRQNVLICFVYFLNSLYLTKYKRKTHWNIKNGFYIAIVLIVLLYGFGVFGNMRYASMWAWNNSGMILKLGKANGRMPSFIPGEFFWAYIYAASPLSNLNTNIQMMSPNNSFSQFLYELIPQVVSNKIGLTRATVHLPVKALSVCTSYARAYNTMGYLGMFFVLEIEFLLCILITILTLKNNKRNIVPQIFGLSYFLLLSVFTNPFSYSISGVMMVLMFIKSFRYKSLGENIRCLKKVNLV